MVKPKKGSKVVPKDKVPLRELPLPYEVLAGRVSTLACGCRRFRPRQQLQDHSYPIDREMGGSQIGSPRATRIPTRPMASNLLQQDIQID